MLRVSIVDRSRPDNRSACSVPTSAHAHPIASRVSRNASELLKARKVGSNAWAAADAISRAAVSAVPITRLRVTFDPCQQLAPVEAVGLRTAYGCERLWADDIMASHSPN